ncbi:MAG: hypothetical protein ACRCZI_13245, partial [Cetobacterium sp.]
INRRMFESILRDQTRGIDFSFYYYFIKQYNLSRDNNGMIIFNDDFDFNTSTKKESLFIDAILAAIKKHDLLKNFLHLIEYEFQFSFKRSSSILAGKKYYDLAFPKLNIVLEIDEKHTDDQKENDEMKDSYAKINDMVIIRVVIEDFAKDRNFEEDILNNEIFADKLDEIFDTIIASLFSKHIKVAQRYIVDGCHKSLIKTRDTISKELEKCNKQLQNKSLDSNDMNYYKNIKIELIEKIDTLNTIIDKESISTNFGFKKYFELKYNFDNKNELIHIDILKNIKLIDSDQSILEFKKFIYLHDIALEFYDNLYDYNKIQISSLRFTWNELLKITALFKHSVDSIKLMTLYYLLEVEKSFTYIHKKIKMFNDS